MFEGTPHNQLWVTDVKEHRTREGTICGAVVLDTFSREVVGWALDSAPNALLVINALAMAIETRSPKPGTVIHSESPWVSFLLLSVCSGR